MPKVGDTLEGRYEISQVLATGGMGVILKARHVRMGREVAVKILHPHIAQEANVVARFEREVRLAQMLNHPNSIRLYDFGEAENGLIYVVMELLDGADLKEILNDTGPIPLGRAVDLTMQVLDGLGEAHEQDFVHRDLKPSNIFVVKDRRGGDLVKILDFGIAKSLEEGTVDLTASGSICGTAAYVAPEYLHDPSPKKAADVYAVGLIMLEMISGSRVFRGTTTAQTLMMQMQREILVPRPIAATPLGEVIARAAAKDPAHRYKDADEMFQALEAIADELPKDLRLKQHQVGDLLRPPSSTFPGMGQSTGELPTGQRDSSSSLPQVRHTPPTGDHAVPPLPDSAPVEELDDDTLVTPLPPSMSHPRTHTAHDITADGARSKQSKISKKNKLVWAGVAVLAGLIVALGAFVLADPADDGGAEGVAQGVQADQQAGQQADQQAAEAGAGAIAAPNESDRDEGEQEKAAAKPDAPIEYRLQSSPSQAVVYDGDEELGQTPLEHEFAPDELPRTLRIEKDGFEAASVELSAEADKSQQVMLIEAEEPEPADRNKQVNERAHQADKQSNKPTRPKRQKPATKKKPNKGEENVDEFLDEYL